MKSISRCLLLILAASAVFQGDLASAQSPDSNDWNQWGGINRNFRIFNRDDIKWDESPRQVWSKKVGPGHSAIVTDSNCGYVQYLDGENEVVRKFRLETGRTVWEYRYKVNYASSNLQYSGPHATPALSNNRIVVASIDARIRAVELDTGSLIWERNLCKEFGTELPQSGYASSPLIFEDMIFIPTLGQGEKVETETFNPDLESKIPGMVALGLNDGRTVWQSKSFRSSHGSPILVSALGQPMVILHGMFELVAVKPHDGQFLWRKLLRNRAADNVSFTPIWNQKNNQILVSHGYCSKGTQAVGIAKLDDSWKATIEWTNRNMIIVHTNAVLCNEVLLGTNRSPTTLMTAIKVEDGSTLFRKRGFNKSNLLGSDDFAIILDESGELVGANIEATGLNKLWQLKVTDGAAWTVPTLVGKNLYVRDAKELKMYSFETKL